MSCNDAYFHSCDVLYLNRCKIPWPFQSLPIFGVSLPPTSNCFQASFGRSAVAPPSSMIQLDHHEDLLPLARCCSSWWSKPEMQGLQWLQVTVWPHFQVARSELANSGTSVLRWHLGTPWRYQPSNVANVGRGTLHEAVSAWSTGASFPALQLKQWAEVTQKGWLWGDLKPHFKTRGYKIWKIPENYGKLGDSMIDSLNLPDIRYP